MLSLAGRPVQRERRWHLYPRLFAAIAALAAVSAVGQEVQWENTKNGALLNEGNSVDDIPNKDLDTCKQLCEENPKCNSFAYDPTIDRPHARQCHLKDRCVDPDEPLHINCQSPLYPTHYKTYYKLGCQPSSSMQASYSEYLENCTNGVIALKQNRIYVVETPISLDCSLKGAENTTIELKGSLEFSGDRLELQGPLRFQGLGTGGCVEVSRRSSNLTVSGRVEFRHCVKAAGPGGAIYVAESELVFKDAHMVFRDCRAGNFGGAIAAMGSGMLIQSSNFSFKNCSAEDHGGAIYLCSSSLDSESRCDASRGLFLRRTSGRFTNCVSDRGGAISNQAEQTHFEDSNVTFAACSSEEGAVAVHNINFEGSDVTFQECKATLLTKGGAITASGNISYASEARVAFYTMSLATVSARYQGDQDQSGKQTCGAGQFVDWVEHPAESSEDFVRYSGTMVNQSFTSCEECLEGSFSLIQKWSKPHTSATRCKSCGKEFIDHFARGAFNCVGNRLKFPRGTMGRWDKACDDDVLNCVFRCPNLDACPGGQLESIEEVEQMCKNGHTATVHPGCVACEKGWGRQSRDPYTCTTCPTHYPMQYWPYAKFLSPIITLSISLLITKGKNENSIKMNMMISDLTLAGLIFPTFDGACIKNVLIENAFQAGSDVVSDAFAYNGNIDCLQLFSWMANTWYGMLFAALAVPVVLLGVLMLWDAISLSERGERLKYILRHVMVWQNLFLPGISGAFIKFTVIWYPRELGEAQLAWFPEFPNVDATRWHIHPNVDATRLFGVLGFLFCVLTGPGLWVFLIASHKWPKGTEQEAQEALKFLTNGYKKRWQYWEAVRLLHRMILTGVVVRFPPSAHRVLFLTMVLGVNVLALLLYGFVMPFEEDAGLTDEMELVLYRGQKQLNKIQGTSLSLSCLAIVLLLLSTSGQFPNLCWWAITFQALAFLVFFCNFCYLGYHLSSHVHDNAQHILGWFRRRVAVFAPLPCEEVEVDLMCSSKDPSEESNEELTDSLAESESPASTAEPSDA